MALKIEFCNKNIIWNDDVEISINNSGDERLELHIIEFTKDILNIDKNNISELEKEIKNNDGFVNSVIDINGTKYNRKIYWVDKIGYKSKNPNVLEEKNYYIDTKLIIEVV